MKRTLSLSVILIFALTLAQPLMALDINSGVGLGYSGRFDSGEPILDAILGARLGVWADFVFPLGASLYAGPEIGMQFLSWDLESGVTVLLSDYPVLFKIGLRSSFASIEAMAGVLFSLDMVTQVFFGMHALAGLRASLGPLWIEGAMAMNIPPLEDGERELYPRVFIGYRRRVFESSPNTGAF